MTCTSFIVSCFKFREMEKSMSKRDGPRQPSYWPDSRSGNLPEIFASEDAEVVVKTERKKRCVLPPIVERNPECRRRIKSTELTVENTYSAIGRSGSFNFSQNDQCENLNGYKSRRFLNNRTNAAVDGEVSNRRETAVEGFVRRDAALVSTDQRTAVAKPHPRASFDTKKPRTEKTCPTSENVITEEIYLLSLNEQAIPMQQKSPRQEIYSHPSLRETRSIESNGGRGVSRCGEILSRRVYYSDSATDLSPSEELAIAVGLARKSRRRSGIPGHPTLRKTRSDESNGFSEIRPCGTSSPRGLATASDDSLHIKKGGDQVVNMTGEVKAKSEEDKGQRMSTERANEGHSEAAGAAEAEQEQRPQLQGVSDAEEEAKGREEEIFAYGVTAESVKRQKQRRRRQGVSEVNNETRDMKKACSVTAESVKRQKQQRPHQRVSEVNSETRDMKEENLACIVTAESVERQKQRRRRQGVSEVNAETRDMKEENLACSVTAESVEEQVKGRRRDGVCETVDKTAARRRRAKVLRKKLFGEDLPIDYELMIERSTERGLNKRL